jgi:hypothetical protein
MVSMGNKAYMELQTKVSALGIGTTKEVSAPIPVDAGVTSLRAGAGLPADLLYPKFLQERGRDSTDNWIDMKETDWEPNNKPKDRLECWSWREDELKFPECAIDRDILLRYAKTLGDITGLNSPILIINSQQWLACRLASLASRFLGSNPGRADALSGELMGIWDDFRITLVKRRQSIPVRRKRTRYRIN